ncbi:MAG: phage holin family protein [Planctomycetales bacterium]|nr:phage holin family protein [Planctomycetales bacterium]
MVNFQTEVNGEPRRQGPVSGFASQAANVLGDVLELAELQAKLAKADAVRASGAATRPLGLLVLGACAAIASLPVLTLGLATMTAELSPLHAWQAQLLVGTAVALIACATVYFSIRRLRLAVLQFRQSADELAKNVAWAKSVVRSSGRGSNLPNRDAP